MEKNFYDLVVKFITTYLEGKEIKLVNTTYNKLEVEKELEDTIINNLYPLVEDSFLIDFQLWKEKGISPEESSINTYYELISEEFIGDFFSRFKELEHMLNKRVIYFEKYINKILLDLETFKNDFYFTYLKSISLDAGDSHAEGKSVCIINLDDTRYIYKPRMAELDQRFMKLIQSQIREYDFTIYSYDTFSIHELIVYKSPESIEDIEKYYYNIGVISAIMYAFKSTDMHYENVIVSNRVPFFVDLETLVGVKRFKEDNPVLAFLDYTTDSVLDTMIYPTYMRESDLNISALTGGAAVYNDFHYTQKVIVDYNSDSVRYEEAPIVIEDKLNRIYSKDKIVHPIDYLECIKDGFKSMSEKMWKNKKYFTNAFLEVIEGNFVRQVLRPTHVYAKFLTTSYEAYYMQKDTYRAELFNILLSNNENDDKQKAVAEEEVGTLLNGDIPIFYAYFNDRHLYNHKGEIVCEDYFLSSSKDMIMNRIEEYSEQEMNRQIYHIESSLFISAYNNKSDDPVLSQSQSSKEMYGEAQVISDLKEFSELIVDRGGYFVSLLPSHAGDKCKLSSINSSLYEYGGTILLMSHFRDELELSVDYFKKIISSIKSSKLHFPELLDAFTGIGSYIYINYLLFKNTSETFFIEEVNDCYKLLKIDFSKEYKIDYITGLSGISVLLANLLLDDSIYLSNKFKDASKLFLEDYYVYLSKALNSVTIGAGFAHGYSGIILGLSSANVILKNIEINKLVNQLIEKEELLYVEEKNNYLDPRDNALTTNYYCYGLPGILLSKIQLIKIGECVDLKDLNKKLTGLCNAIINNELELDKLGYCLCHGIGSFMEIIEEAYKEGLISHTLYIEVQTILMEKLNSNTNGLLTSNNLYGFMMGKGSKVYSYLRYVNKDIPAMSLLNVN
ncbi:type 2 lanthipeptide synthetase LanM [Bacillus sp. FSL K6-0273]|uniref:type 2 lanthipeptide synthetase LanM n=1 Tax=Bacillus TaxID=1386 RepID=UPI0015969DFD|nr:MULTISPECIES: type 2 lanthipeptide synthetase LanM [Bacillus cereus group]MDF9468704.1 type 2 lanthipeptide synthetase LanM [Bacillus cereus]